MNSNKGLRFFLFAAILSFLIAGLLVGCSFTSDGNEDTDRRVDSLNSLSYSLRYKSLAKSSEAANLAFQLSSSSPSGKSEALNNMGFCAFMRMDFEHASRLFKRVLEISDNEIECLIADVGLMKIYQRTSENKVFYDYRNGAQRRIKRIRQDRSVFEDSLLLRRFNYALSEFHIVSGVYYYYLQQDSQSLAEIDAINVRSLEADTAQWLYYMYMRGSGGMYTASTPEDVVIGEFGYLMECLESAREWGYVYFEGNALQSMAEILNFRSNRELISKRRKGWLEMINADDCPIDSLPLNLSRKALSLFKKYGDWYQISGTYRTMATYYNYMGHPEKALPLLAKALSYVNLHHEKFYACTDTTDRLLTYMPYAQHSLELEWINDKGIKTVPEWIARLREQLSRTYSAMGMKAESDFNRNVYLDILDYTRQDKELESRYTELEKESSLLNLLLVLVLAGFVVLFVLFFTLNRYWRRRNTLYIENLKRVLLMCRKIMASVPAEASDSEEVAAAISDTVKDDILRLTGADDMWIQWYYSSDDTDSDSESETDSPEEEQSSVVSCEEHTADNSAMMFDIVAPCHDKPVGRLWLKLRAPVSKDTLSLLRLMLPYMAWTMENGMNLVSLYDEKKRLAKEEYILRQHIADNKRQNEIKKACLSIVTGIVPYIDRVVNEVDKLKSAPFAKADAVKLGKLNYIDELLAKINEYNDILALWIKMKRGELSLNIENFSLDEVFSVIVKGRRSFEIKNQELVVNKCDAVVKADKALTLFMINTLVENARKYTPNGGKVEVSVREEEKFVEISVSDNGPGLSASDVERILSEKVYDSGTIGIDTADDVAQLQKQKGNGFGLMNCKGIIEKYRKTNPIFNVCLFSIDSTPKKGSRFYFRLPKGVRRAVFTILVVLGQFVFPVNDNNIISPVALNASVAASVKSASNVSNASSSSTSSAASQVYQISKYDSLLAIANDFANMVYDCNVKSDYYTALDLADSVFFYMNKHYLRYSGKHAPLLTMDGSGEASELQWLASGFDTDYYILLDVRNEVAVASLAVKNFSRYYYNNKAYTTLYKQISEDKSLEEYCVRMQKSSNNKMVALTLIVFLVVGGIVAYYLLYLRRILHYKYNMEQVFSINRSVFASVSVGADSMSDMSDDVCASLIKGMYADVNELVPIDNMVIGMSAGYTASGTPDEILNSLKLTWRRVTDDESVIEKIERCYYKRSITFDTESAWLLVPLQLEIGGEERCIGVWGLQCSFASVREEDLLMIELISGYLAVVLYQTIVQVERQCLDIELAQDDARKAQYEENMLHVQNMVLDNCLSTIKHETIYYPGRLRKIVGSMLDSLKHDTGACVRHDGTCVKHDGKSVSEDNSRSTDTQCISTDKTFPCSEDERLSMMYELVSYYKDVFTILSSCASRQLDEVTFRRTVISAGQLVEYAMKYFRKQSRKLNFSLSLHTDSSAGELDDKYFYGDEILMKFMFENLIEEALRYRKDGKLIIKVTTSYGGFVRFDFIDTRRDFTQEQLNQLFYPDNARICMSETGNELTGTEYLLCRQIMRDHDEFGGKRGCRINASVSEETGGFSVWFTLPQKV